MTTKSTHTFLARFAAASFTCLFLAACAKPEQAEAPQPAAPPDAVQALMLTYETVITPDNKSVRFQVASDGTYVRLGNESENWRLFDTKNRTITFVNQTAGSVSTVNYDQALAERTKQLAAAPTEGMPTATVTEGPGEPERGHPTHRVNIDVGKFSREIVLSTDVLLPGEFYAMKVVTDPLDVRYASIMKDVLPVLVRQNGTLLSETNRFEVEDGNTLTATTKLVSVTTVQLSRKLFEVPVASAAPPAAPATPAADSTAAPEAPAPPEE